MGSKTSTAKKKEAETQAKSTNKKAKEAQVKKTTAAEKKSAAKKASTAAKKTSSTKTTDAKKTTAAKKAPAKKASTKKEPAEKTSAKQTRTSVKQAKTEVKQEEKNTQQVKQNAQVKQSAQTEANDQFEENIQPEASVQLEASAEALIEDALEEEEETTAEVAAKALAEVEASANAAKQDTRTFPELAEALAGSSRRARQNAARKFASQAAKEPNSVLPFAHDLIDALNRPEAQTRWECLDALSSLVEVDAHVCEEALQGAETSLFDEESGPVRLAAMRFLCKLGESSAERANKTWPLIDEGIQCYHGDMEFPDMLVAVTDFAQSKLPDEVKEQLANRVRFDAENGKGALKRKCAVILEYVS